MKYLLPIILLLLAATAAMAADVLVPVYVDSQKMNFTPAARMRDGRTFVPLRDGAKAIGGTVNWDAKAKQARICVGDRCTVIEAKQGINVGGHLLIPLRLMGEALGCGVQWSSAQHAVIITRAKASTFR